jgi:isopenicillin N synthase-like dioxygenase
MREFFALPLQEKRTIYIDKSGVNWKGYVDEGVEATKNIPDQREALWYGRELAAGHPYVRAGLPLHGSNPFPTALPSLRSPVLEWLQEMDRVGRVLSMALAESLGLKANFFSEGMCKDHLGALGLIHYPAARSDSTEWGVGEHTDYGMLTLLMFDQPQLQAQDVDGRWIEIEPVPDAFVVNIGDILEVMTQGLYKSTLHRVRNTSGKSRYSIPYFYDPHWHTKIEALDISLSEEDRRVVERVRACKRWDDASLHQADGIFGHYYLRKLMKAYPPSLQPQFAAHLNS